jgi:hypothetical protein
MTRKKYESNAERQRAYRRRKRDKEYARLSKAILAANIEREREFLRPKKPEISYWDTCELNEENFEEYLYTLDSLASDTRYQLGWVCRDCFHGNHILHSFCRNCGMEMPKGAKGEQEKFVYFHPTAKRWRDWYYNDVLAFHEEKKKWNTAKVVI